MPSEPLSDYSLTLYHAVPSRSTRALWAVHELGIPGVAVRPVRLMAGEQYQPAFRVLNGMSAVPVLVLRHKASGAESAMTESGAIVAFLAESTGRLLPGPGVLARAQYHRLLSLATASVDPVLWDIRLHEQLLPERLRVKSVAQLARKKFAEKVVPTLESALGDGARWACAPHCERFTAADIMLGYSLFWASVHGLLKDSPVLTRYLERIKARKAFADALGEPTHLAEALKELKATPVPAGSPAKL